MVVLILAWSCRQALPLLLKQRPLMAQLCIAIGRRRSVGLSVMCGGFTGRAIRFSGRSIRDL